MILTTEKSVKASARSLPPAKSAVGLLTELKAAYEGFTWESELWSGCGHRRSPFRTLVLFGLSARTRDALLVEMCDRFFRRYPDEAALADAGAAAGQGAGDIVRLGQVPIVVSVAAAIAGGVSREREKLLRIKGVGEKIAECVLAYGWGDDALPLDANCVRVLERVFGESKSGSRRPSPAPLREWLKCVYLMHSQEFAELQIKMVDIHEILRLHGQICCTRTPECSRCPVSSCASRRAPWDGVGKIEVSYSLWDGWRELINEPV